VTHPVRSTGEFLLKTCLVMIAIGVLVVIAFVILLWSVCGRGVGR
jgi:hypothetical protein